MTQTKALIESAYAAFNARDVDSALGLMSDGVSWSKASEGGKVVGKAEVRAYWTRQWATFDPHVEPLEIMEIAPGQVEVRVHQRVKDLSGHLLADGEVCHIFTVHQGLISSMDLKHADASGSPGPTAAFNKRT